MAKRRSKRKNRTTKREWKGIIAATLILAALFTLKFFLIAKSIELFSILFLDPIDTAIGFVFLSLFLFILREFFNISLFGTRK